MIYAEAMKSQTNLADASARLLATSKVARDGAWNMAVDEALFGSAPECAYPATLRIYRWSRPTLSLGRRQKFSEVDFSACRKRGVDVVKRFAGGSAVYHHEEVTYCLTARLDAGNRVMDEGIWRMVFVDFLERMGINPDAAMARVDAAGPTCFSAARYDEPTVKGRKWVGSARRKNRKAFMQHGSIILKPQPAFLGELLPKTQTDISDGLRSFAPNVSAEEVEKQFVSAVERGFNFKFTREDYTTGELTAIEKIYEQKRREMQAGMPAPSAQ